MAGFGVSPVMTPVIISITSSKSLGTKRGWGFSLSSFYTVCEIFPRSSHQTSLHGSLTRCLAFQLCAVVDTSREDEVGSVCLLQVESTLHTVHALQSIAMTVHITYSADVESSAVGEG